MFFSLKHTVTMLLIRHLSSSKLLVETDKENYEQSYIIHKHSKLEMLMTC